MIPIKHAKLAAIPLLFLLIAMGQAQQPLKVKFHLADGVRIAGDLTAWDRDGFNGTFGRRLWIDLNVDDLWKIYQQVMDDQNAEQWVDLGGVLLQVSHRDAQADDLAERAFRRALKLDGGVRPRIDAARQEAAELDRLRRVQQAKSEQAKLKTISPEGDDWPADPWPVISDIEHEAAVHEMRADAQKRLQALGLNLTPVESEHFLVFSDLPRPDVAKIAIQLEKTCQAFGEIMMPLQQNERRDAQVAPRWFWGKAVVFIFRQQDQFRLIEAESFRQLVPQTTLAICHPIGPKVFINAHRSDDAELFNWMLMHTTVQGILHGYQSPRRLPAWANDGLAERIAGIVLRDSPLVETRRQTGIDFIRMGGNLNAMLDLSYAEQSWPGPNQIGLPVGGLIVELLLHDRDLFFIDWVKAVKRGEDWQKAMRPQLALTRQSLVETVSQYYKVND